MLEVDQDGSGEKVSMQAAVLMVLLLASWKRREGRQLGSSAPLTPSQARKRARWSGFEWIELKSAPTVLLLLFLLTDT